MQPMVIRLILIVLIVACGAGFYFAVDTIQAAPLKAAQAAALTRFGPDVLKKCQGVTSAKGGKLPADAKIAVINSVDNDVYDIYDTALPGNIRATDKSDVNVLLCLTEKKSVFHTDFYGASKKYSCIQYARDMVGYLVDVKTGQTLDTRQFDGQEPPDCPDKTDANLTRTGDIPEVSDITNWITHHAKANV